VATIAKDGHPHLTTLWYAPYGDGVVFETCGKSQKVVNLRRDPRIFVRCEAGRGYDELRGVSIRGRAELVESGPRLQGFEGIELAADVWGAEDAWPVLLMHGGVAD
jgi:general stress protein 26